MRSSSDSAPENAENFDIRVLAIALATCGILYLKEVLRVAEDVARTVLDPGFNPDEIWGRFVIRDPLLKEIDDLPPHERLTILLNCLVERYREFESLITADVDERISRDHLVTVHGTQARSYSVALIRWTAGLLDQTAKQLRLTTPREERDDSWTGSPIDPPRFHEGEFEATILQLSARLFLRKRPNLSDFGALNDCLDLELEPICALRAEPPQYLNIILNHSQCTIVRTNWAVQPLQLTSNMWALCVAFVKAGASGLSREQLNNLPGEPSGRTRAISTLRRWVEPLGLTITAGRNGERRILVEINVSKNSR